MLCWPDRKVKKITYWPGLFFVFLGQNKPGESKMATIVSGVADLALRIPEIWSPKMYDDLRADLLMGSYFSRDFEGEIRNVGDKVRVQQLTPPTGEIITAANDENEFSTEALVLTEYTLDIDRRASAAYEFTDLAQLQSLPFAAMAQEALVYSVSKQMEDYIVSLLVPHATHDIAPAVASDLGVEDLATAKLLLDEYKAPKMDRVAFVSSSYHADLMIKQLVASRDYTNSSSIQTGIVDKLLGMTIVQCNNLPADTAFICHKSALQVAMQQSLRVKVSDQHSSRRYQYVMSADFVFGAKLFDNKRIVKISG